ncbi:MAG TPA: MCE family protein [Pseudonocardiaceae bacterium]|jgi:virulence factor Mce-like protein
MFATRSRKRVLRYASAMLVLVLIAAGALFWLFRDLGAKTITAYFDEAVGVYAGSDLRVLGVTVGTIDSVQPQGKQVKVVMTLDDGVQVPANADAAVISPSVVSDRYVQLTPAYTGGPQMKDNATIPIGRTQTPVELDQLYSTLNQLATALGPNGANKNGALSNLLNVGAANLDGNGAALGTMIQQLGAATRTLSGSQDNLFQTIDSLQQFTTMLKNNNDQVQSVTQQLASVSGFLAADRQDLGQALNQLADALAQVQGFIRQNRGRIQSNVTKLNSISQILTNERSSLAEALDDAPLAVDNLLGAYDTTTHTLDGRGYIPELAPGTPQNSFAPVTPDQAKSLPELPLPLGTVYGKTSGGGR